MPPEQTVKYYFSGRKSTKKFGSDQQAGLFFATVYFGNGSNCINITMLLASYD